MNKQKKDFWDMSFNPVWGCKNNCLYCYARKIARRYAGKIAEKEILNKNSKYDYFDITNLYENLQNFFPTWLESNYVRKFPKKPSIIFVNSMSDPAYWEQEWYEKIVKRIAENMQHTFVVLTKFPKVYEIYKFPDNTILGFSITNNKILQDWSSTIEAYSRYEINRVLLSIEPIQEKINIELIKKLYPDWIHIGQESGNRRERIKATREMIEPFFDIEAPVFMKNNLSGIVPGRKLRKEYPEL